MAIAEAHVAVFMLATAMAATPEREAPPVRLALAQIAAINAESRLIDFCGAHLAQQMNLQGVRVVSRNEIGVLLGNEREKQLLGCTDDGCMAEIASALNTDGVVLGEIARVGTAYQVNLRVISAKNADWIAGFSGQAASEGDLVEVLSRGAAALVDSVLVKLSRARAPVAAPPAKPSGISLRTWAWVPAGVGVLAAGGGAYFSAQAIGVHDQLLRASLLTASQADDLRKRGWFTQGAAAVAFSVGAVALGTAGVLFAVGGPKMPARGVAFGLGADGRSLWVAGALP